MSRATPPEGISAGVESVFDGGQPAEAAARRTESDSQLVRALIAAGALDWHAVREAREIQRRTGDPIGRILVALRHVPDRDVAEALAAQLRLPYVPNPEPAAQTTGLLPDDVCRVHRILPLSIDGGVLVVAVADPVDWEALRALEAASPLPTRLAVAPERAIEAGLERLFSGRYLDAAATALRRERPEESAHFVLSRGQKIVFTALALAFVASLVLETIPTLIAFSALSIAFYCIHSTYKLVLIYWAERHSRQLGISKDAIAQLDEQTLPRYTLLVPLYHEADVLPQLVDAIVDLDYPKTKLDVKLLLEPDDLDTIEAAAALRLGPPFQLLVVPESRPKTKPKACNYGLRWARGEFVVIYDAEDRPERDQLKKAVIAFRELGPEVACVQAKLNYWNRDQNVLTGFFTAEYSHHFDMILPGLDATDAPIPLGGTSNHFRIDVIRKLGAWDPFNVAEDADLGIRLARAGFRTAMMDSTTYEEANSRLYNWIRQRSRWVKGYIQTWLVHMRHPVRLSRELGLRNWLSFQLVVGGTFLTLLLNPLFWALTILWLVTEAGVIQKMFPGVVYFAGSFNLLIGNFLFVYLNVAGVLRRRYDNLVKLTFLSPLYWLLMTIGAWKGLLQLVRRPSYWEKTQHGLARP